MTWSKELPKAQYIQIHTNTISFWLRPRCNRKNINQAQKKKQSEHHGPERNSDGFEHNLQAKTVCGSSTCGYLLVTSESGVRFSSNYKSLRVIMIYHDASKQRKAQGKRGEVVPFSPFASGGKDAAPEESSDCSWRSRWLPALAQLLDPKTSWVSLCYCLLFLVPPIRPLVTSIKAILIISDFNFGPCYIVIGACSTTHHNSLLRVRFVRTSCNNDGKDPSLKHLGCIKTKQNAAVHLGNF